jgi:hypothetical protein
VVQSLFAQSIEETEGTKTGHISRIFRDVEADPHMTLSTEVVHLVGCNVSKESTQTTAVGKVAEVEEEATTTIMFIVVQVVNAVGIKVTGSPYNPMDNIPFVEEEFG